MLEGYVALVTGGARGIGRAICQELGENGASVALMDVMEKEAEGTATEMRDKNIDCKAFAANVVDSQDVDRAIKEVMDAFGRIDVLVNNAGITRDNLLVRLKEDDWDKVIEVNLKGTYNCMKAVTRPMMKARGGCIVNIASVVGVTGNAGQSNYSASKAGIIGLTKSAARELGSRGIRVNAVAPGYIETAMTDKLSEEARQRFLESLPLQRPGSPVDVARVVKFLASPDSEYITGQVINVDGGMVT